MPSSGRPSSEPVTVTMGYWISRLRTLRSEFGRFFKRDGVGHSGADPDGAFVEMRHEFAADERHKEK